MKTHAILGIVLCFTSTGSALSQQYPSRPVRMIVGFTPGGGADTIARIIGARFSERTKQTLVIDNRPGAGGMVGTAIVAKSAPDGYNLLLANASFATNIVLYAKTVTYDIHEFAPIFHLGSSQYLLTINPSVPATSIKELIALAKSRPGKMNSASAGLGGPGHLSLELFKMLTGTDIVHVPYKGTSPVVTSLLGNETQMVFGNAGAMAPLARSGKLRGLAVTGAARSPVAPEYSTGAEAGVP